MHAPPLASRQDEQKVWPHGVHVDGSTSKFMQLMHVRHASMASSALITFLMAEASVASRLVTMRMRSSSSLAIFLRSASERSRSASTALALPLIE